uniref:Uncharacterized protein n=1 Tax=Eutreptiella gymnastica TaxID=73025 RepID=A0A7S4LKD9_9EUGL
MQRHQYQQHPNAARYSSAPFTPFAMEAHRTWEPPPPGQTNHPPSGGEGGCIDCSRHRLTALCSATQGSGGSRYPSADPELATSSSPLASAPEAPSPEHRPPPPQQQHSRVSMEET